MEKMQKIERVIKALLTEHLDAYALVAYDTEGNELMIMHTPTDRDVRAINDAYKNWYEESFNVDPVEAECEWEDDGGEDWAE